MAPRHQPATIAYPRPTNCNRWTCDAHHGVLAARSRRHTPTHAAAAQPCRHELRAHRRAQKVPGGIVRFCVLPINGIETLTGLAKSCRAQPRPLSRRRGEADALQQSGIYSIISSARASSKGDTVIPSVCAVLRLMTSSYLVGACMGRSAGFSPLRMRSM